VDILCVQSSFHDPLAVFLNGNGACRLHTATQ
jgi:hypothetical protein